MTILLKVLMWGVFMMAAAGAASAEEFCSPQLEKCYMESDAVKAACDAAAQTDAARNTCKWDALSREYGCAAASGCVPEEYL